MSAPKLHLDEDADAHALLNGLRQRGCDVSSSRERGLFGCSDEEQLAWATAAKRAVITYNAADFCRLHAETLRRSLHHAGIIIGDQQTASIGEEIRRLLRLCDNKKPLKKCRIAWNSLLERGRTLVWHAIKVLNGYMRYLKSAGG